MVEYKEMERECLKWAFSSKIFFAGFPPALLFLRERVGEGSHPTQNHEVQGCR